MRSRNKLCVCGCGFFTCQGNGVIRSMVRHDDHETSIEAAEKVATEKTEKQQMVYEAFQKYGSMTDEVLEALPAFAEWGATTARKRRTELFQSGKIEKKGRAINSMGSSMFVWGIS